MATLSFRPWKTALIALVGGALAFAVLATASAQTSTAPVANNDFATTVKNQAVTIDVLANDSDPDTPVASLIVSLGTAPAHGSIALTAEQHVTYTPNTDFVGTDSFTYVLSDGTESDTATVTVTVRPKPHGGPGELNAAVVAACEAHADADNGAATLCRLYLSGELPPWAQQVIGRVILKQLEQPKPERHERIRAICAEATEPMLLRLCATYESPETSDRLRQATGKLILQASEGNALRFTTKDKDDDRRGRITFEALTEVERGRWEAFWDARFEKQADADARRAAKANGALNLSVELDDDDDDDDKRSKRARINAGVGIGIGLSRR